jgi:hypothetical protein
MNTKGVENEISDEQFTAELLEALKAYQALDTQRMNCEDCEDCLEQAPEACGKCFPFADDARLKMRAAISKAYARAKLSAAPPETK